MMSEEFVSPFSNAAISGEDPEYESPHGVEVGGQQEQADAEPAPQEVPAEAVEGTGDVIQIYDEDGAVAANIEQNAVPVLPRVETVMGDMVPLNEMVDFIGDTEEGSDLLEAWGNDALANTKYMQHGASLMLAEVAGTDPALAEAAVDWFDSLPEEQQISGYEFLASVGRNRTADRNG